jgi:hypothetical protein
MKIIILVLSITFSVESFSQGSTFSNNNFAEFIVNRLEILDSNAQFYAGFKNYRRNDVYDLIQKKEWNLSKIDDFNISFLNQELIDFQDSLKSDSLKSLNLWNTFYKNQASFYAYKNQDFFIRINPILALTAGKVSGQEANLFQNTRGLEIHGNIQRRFSFYFQVTENQMRHPDFVNQYSLSNKYASIPQFTYWKDGNSNAIDFSNSIGYIDYSFPKYFSITFGHDRHFYGHGYRSLFLSDQAAPALFLKSQIRFWKLNYQVLFNELVNQYQRGADRNLLRKYAATHLLTFKPSSKIELSFFESIVFNRNNGFDIQYLNPLMFYRSLEHTLGSADNSLMGFQFKWNIQNQFQVYSQLLIDDLKINELVKQSGWWGNKYALQLGGKYLNMGGIKNLDGQVEFNMVRPYTYSHYNIDYKGDTLSNYTHYNQTLAHPLGANFTEWIFRLNYQPIPRLLLEAKYFLIQRGADTANAKFGSDIFASIPGNNIPNTFGVTQNQGVANTIHILSLQTQYMLWHNLFIDFDVFYRNSSFNSVLPSNNSFGLSAGLRLNFRKRENYF